MFDILPGILEKEVAEIERKLNLVKPFARSIHVDLLDGKFAPNTTILDPKIFSKYAQDFMLEVHMMVEEPINYLESFADAGFGRFIGHVEKMSSQEEFVAKAEALGEVVLGIDLTTPISEIKVPYIDLDGILVMTVKAGFSGQKFDESALEKVREIVKRDSLITVQVDGGIGEQSIVQAKDAGATRFVATSYLYSSGESPEAQYKNLSKCLVGRG